MKKTIGKKVEEKVQFVFSGSSSEAISDTCIRTTIKYAMDISKGNLEKLIKEVLLARGLKVEDAEITLNVINCSEDYEGEDYVFNIGARLVQYSDLKIGIPEINGDKL